MKEDHHSYRCNFKFAIAKLESLKKIRARMGFQPYLTSAILVQLSYELS